MTLSCRYILSREQQCGRPKMVPMKKRARPSDAESWSKRVLLGSGRTCWSYGGRAATGKEGGMEACCELLPLHLNSLILLRTRPADNNYYTPNPLLTLRIVNPTFLSRSTWPSYEKTIAHLGPAGPTHPPCLTPNLHSESAIKRLFRVLVSSQISEEEKFLPVSDANDVGPQCC